MKKILYIGNKLSRHGYTPSSIDILVPKLKDLGFNIVSASTKVNKLFRLIDMLTTIYNNRKEASFLLIDTYSTQNFYFAVLGSRLAKFHGIPYIPILRGGNLITRFENSKSLSSKLLKDAYANVVPSQYLQNKVEALGYTNLTYIPNTISIEDYEFKVSNYDVPHLLWVRSFAEIYNPILAVKVYKKLLVTFPTATLTMVGPEKDSSLNECKSYAEKHHLNVNFTGLLAKDEWRRLSKKYNIFLNTTNVDNTPVSVIEAMALGLCVVSTNVGGLPFLLEHKKEGLLVKANNEAIMLEAIFEVINNPDNTYKMIHNARQKAESFNWQIVKLDWVNLLS